MGTPERRPPFQTRSFHETTAAVERNRGHPTCSSPSLERVGRGECQRESGVVHLFFLFVFGRRSIRGGSKANGKPRPGRGACSVVNEVERRLINGRRLLRPVVVDVVVFFFDDDDDDGRRNGVALRAIDEPSAPTTYFHGAVSLAADGRLPPFTLPSALEPNLTKTLRSRKNTKKKRNTEHGGSVCV